MVAAAPNQKHPELVHECVWRDSGTRRGKKKKKKRVVKKVDCVVQKGCSLKDTGNKKTRGGGEISV